MVSFEEDKMTKKGIIYMVIFFISIFSVIQLVQAQYEDPQMISLDLKGMDIRDVLKILSQKSGLNIVADKDVKGTVSIYLRDVDVMNALDIIVSTNHLAYEEKGTLIRIMSDKRYERLHGARFKDRIRTEIIKLDYAKASMVGRAIAKMKTRLGRVITDDASDTIFLRDTPESIETMKDAILEMDTPLITEVFSLDYAKAKSVKEKLEKMLSDDIGSIRFDERTNKVVVKDTPEKIEDMRKVIKAFDEKTREVVIDANIIKVTLSDKYSYGIDWADIAQLGGLRLTGNTNLTTALSGTTPNTLTIATTGGNYATVISLLKTYGKTDVLSRPRITVADKEEANILVGAKDVYVTSEVTTTSGGTYHTTDHVQFVDVGVRLSVTPEINSQGYIRLKIKPEVSDTDSTKTVRLTNPDGSTRSIIPYVTTSEAETTVLVKDNTTLILGGLMKDTITEYNEKVPFLGDIPFLGKLFSTKGKSKEKTELVIFLTPHIIGGDKLTEEARSYMGEWKKKQEEARIKEPQGPGFKFKNISKSKNPKMIRKSKPAASVRAQKKKVQRKKTLRPKFKKRKAIAERSRYRKRSKKAEWTPLLQAPSKKTETRVFKREGDVKDLLVSEKTPYEDYYLTIREEINDMVARQDVSGLKGEVELQFTLDNKGFIIKGPMVLNKPDLKLVRNAVKCLKDIVPFPSFPRVLKKKEAEFYVVVRYE